MNQSFSKQMLVAIYCAYQQLQNRERIFWEILEVAFTKANVFKPNLETLIFIYHKSFYHLYEKNGKKA